MYIRKENNKTSIKYTNEETGKIVRLYLNGEMRVVDIMRKFNIVHKSVLYKWIKMYREYGCISDYRGKATKLNNSNKGRPREYPEKPLEGLSKEELIERVRMLEDIKNPWSTYRAKS